MSDEDWDNDDTAMVKETRQNYQARGESGYNRKPSDNYRRYDRDNGRDEKPYERREERNHRPNNECSQEMGVRSDQIGRLIGRGGENIKRLQSDFNVHINIDKNTSNITVSGASDSIVQDAIDNIKNQLGNDGGDSRQQNRGERSYPNNRSSYGRDNNNYNHNEGNRHSSSAGNSYHHEKKFESYEPTSEGNNMIDWDKLNERSEVARKERWAHLPPLIKNFYKEAPEVANLKAEEVAKLREENNNITVARVFQQENGESDNIPNPIWKFEQCFADFPDLLEEIYKQKFEKPSPIQSQAWPVLLQGEDLIGIAQTGTGKTLAFLLPAMIHTECQTTPRSQRDGPNVLIMAPTRELALQIEKEVNKYSFRNMKAVCVYGGGNRREQIADVESGVELIICTPGRLNDLIEAKVIKIDSITYLVLDEADRMLDMGFEPQIRKVLLDIRPDRQTIMTSATWPPGVRRLAQSYMQNPIQVCVGSLDLAATGTVQQIIEVVDEGDKEYLIRKFIKSMKPNDKIIIFMGKKTRADDLSSDLTIEGFMCTAIHGAREQCDREQAIADISSGDIRILIATDVASRGLDIEDITHVINYDFPRNIEEYVHRVGRTGRAGRTGTSISFITRSDWGMARELIEILEKGDQHVPDELRDMAERFKSAKARQASEGRSGRGGGGGGGRGGRGRGGGGGGGQYRNHHF